MILMMAKYHENLLIHRTLSLLFIVKFFSSLETKMILKIPNKTFLRITRYLKVHNRSTSTDSNAMSANHYKVIETGDVTNKSGTKME